MTDFTDITRPVVASARKRTKIVATLGPATSTLEAVRGLVRAGAEIFRLNMSHGVHADHKQRLDLVRQVSKDLDVPLAVLADLQGPKIRTGRLAGDQAVEWKEGMQVVITVAACPEGTATRVGTTYAGLADDATPGSFLLVDDGRMKLRVERQAGDDLHCVVVVGGMLKNNKGINLPGIDVKTPSLSDKDLEDLQWAIDNKVDVIALSFVRTANDVRNLKDLIARAGSNIPVISKIEKPEAVENIDAILDVTDGIMVARGDLGIEISTQNLPTAQKTLIRRANRKGKIVITATQMLESMIDSPIPTRAETSDVANAVFDGTDAVMLSGETAYGKFPEDAVREMARISNVAEKSTYITVTAPERGAIPGLDSVAFALAASAEALARDLPAQGIVVLNDPKGDIVRLLGKRRHNLPIVATCEDEVTWRRAALQWACMPVLAHGTKPETNGLFQTGLFQAAVDQTVKQGGLKIGDTVVVISRSGPHSVDSVSIRQIRA
jgi:pyruvate kinase